MVSPISKQSCVFVYCLCFQIGQFFGMIEPSLMRNLINETLFAVNITYDYQALCEPTKESKAAAGLRSVYVVSFTFFKYITVSYAYKQFTHSKIL